MKQEPTYKLKRHPKTHVELSKADEIHKHICIVYSFLMKWRIYHMAEHLRMILDDEVKPRIIDIRKEGKHYEHTNVEYASKGRKGLDDL